MNNTATPASFSFQSHKIKKIVFNAPNSEKSNISIGFDPTGVYHLTSSTFTLTLGIKATYGEKGEFTLAEVITEGIFEFEGNTKFEEIPDFFYTNAIAILFPYVRAFITTFTSVGNVKPLILPTLNLSSLANPLKENTTSE